MTTPPQKPHFFQPIKPGFNNGIMIPKSFFKYLKGMKCDHAVLRRGHKKWPVIISGSNIKEGWNVFAEDNDLKVGDFVMFRHEGNLIFEVIIFDKSGCEKEYKAIYVGEAEPTPSKAVDIEKKRPSKKLKTKRSEDSSTSKQSRKLSGGRTSEQAYPYFIVELKPFSVKESRLNIPLDFAKANGIYNRTCQIILKDQMQRIFHVWLRHNKDHVYIGQGWKEFRNANELKEGDYLLFEMINNGETPVLEFYDLGSNQSTMPVGTLDEKSTRADGSGKENEELVTRFEEERSSASTANPYFVSTVKPSKFPYLSIPMEFAKSNGLDRRRCEVIMMDSSGRTWSVELEPKETEVIIRRGWVKFLMENGLEEGDTFKLELISKGDKPSMKYHGISFERGGSGHSNGNGRIDQ